MVRCVLSLYLILDNWYLLWHLILENWSLFIIIGDMPGGMYGSFHEQHCSCVPPHVSVGLVTLSPHCILDNLYLIINTWYLILYHWYLINDTWILDTWRFMLINWYLIIHFWYWIIHTHQFILTAWVNLPRYNKI